MSHHFGRLLILLGLFSGLAWGQSFADEALASATGADKSGTDSVTIVASAPDFISPIALPRMAPDLALDVFAGRSLIQAQRLAAYTAVSEVHAELPDTDQKGDYQLQRYYLAPHTLQFTPLRYTGDGFVKNNVITRLLQSEVDKVKQEDAGQTAINKNNYKFSYKGSAQVNGRLAHIFHVKPRQKRPGLFKGRIALDAYTGSLVRAEGTVVKSPSFFVKKIEFVQDYANFGDFTFPIHIHSNALARVIGHAIVDVYHRNYQPVAVGAPPAQRAALPTALLTP